MAWNIALGLIGALIAGAALRDVFETVAVPGGSRARLKIVRRLVWLCLPILRKLRGAERGIPMSFAPLMLVISFVAWMMLLALGFGFIAYAMRDSFRPPLHSVGDAVYLMATAMTTIGRSDIAATGWGRWTEVAGGFCGLAVMTLAITYLLEVQSGIGQRDTGIVKLNTSAGDPPSALRMLEKFAGIGNRDQLAEVLREGRNWCATVRQSHTNRPSLIYFQSVAAQSGWPAALGALIDLSLMFQLVLPDGNLRGAAVLLGEEATSLATDLATVVGLAPIVPECAPAQAQRAFERLRAAGYQTLVGEDPTHFCAARAGAQSCIAAIAQHLGKPVTVFLPG